MGLSEEKRVWLKSIGAVEQQWNHCKYYVPSTNMHYSEDYIEKTSLTELQAKHKKNLRFMQKD